MRVKKWKVDKFLNDCKEVATAALYNKAEDIAEEARRTVGVNPAVRAGRFSDQLANVAFTPKKGRNKGKPVNFRARRWLGRKPGDLKATIRTVTKEGRPGNIRVMAGNFKQYWAKFAETGVPSRKIPRSLFLRRAFARIAPTIKPYIEKQIDGVPK